LDGFYDLCATGDESTLSIIPSLTELQALPFSHGAKTEAVLVNKALDSELVALEQKAFIMTVEIHSKNSEFVGRTLVQTLANLVSNYMGGPVVDPESMLLKYRNMSSALRADTRSAVIRIGQLKVGLAIAGELELIQEAAGPTRLKDYRAGAKKRSDMLILSWDLLGRSFTCLRLRRMQDLYQQQQHSISPQASWGRIEMKPKEISSRFRLDLGMGHPTRTT